MPDSPSHLRCIALAAALAATAGCGKPEVVPPPAERAENVSTIGVSQCTLEEPWRAQMDADIRAAAARHPGLRVIFKNAAGDSRKQCAQIGRFIADRVDLIIVSPNEAQPLTAVVGKAYDAGIPVIVLDRPVIGDKYTCFIGVDNEQIGLAAGRWLSEKLGGEGKIVELKGRMDTRPAQQRHNGFHQALRDPGYRIFEEVMQWDEAKARKVMQKALEQHDEIDAVFAHNDPGAHGAYQAARQAGREEQIVFIGVDALPHEGIKYVKDGILDATFQNPTGGAEAIDIALRILAGKQAPKTVVLESRIFTAD